MPPNLPTVAATADSTSAAMETSPVSDSTGCPSARRRAAALSTVSASMSKSARLAPSAPNRSALARPMPWAPPMTRTVLPTNLFKCHLRAGPDDDLHLVSGWIRQPLDAVADNIAHRDLAGDHVLHRQRPGGDLCEDARGIPDLERPDPGHRQIAPHPPLGRSRPVAQVQGDDRDCCGPADGRYAGVESTLTTRALDRAVGADATGTLTHLGGNVGRAWVENRAGTVTLGSGPPGRLRLGDEDPARARGSSGEHGQLPDWPGASDEHAVSGPQTRALDTMHRCRQRLEHSRLLERHFVGQRYYLGRGDDRLLGQAAPRPGHTRQPEACAQPLSASKAVVAGAAEYVREHGHAIARPQVARSRPGLGDDRGELVAYHLRQEVGRRVQRAVSVFVQVGAANPAPLRKYPHQAMTDRIGLGHVVNAKVPVPVQPHCQHPERLRCGGCRCVPPALSAERTVCRLSQRRKTL